MPNQPVVSGLEFVRVLEGLGYEFLHYRGSHAVLANQAKRRKMSVPCHGNRPLPKGMLASLLRAAGITADQLRDLLD